MSRRTSIGSVLTLPYFPLPALWSLRGKLLDVQTIRAAVAGEKWAVEKVIEHYSGEIDRLCMITKKQLDVSFKKVVDEDMRQALITKLIEALPQFETEK